MRLEKSSEPHEIITPVLTKPLREVAIATSTFSATLHVPTRNYTSAPQNIMKFSLLSCSLLACLSPLVSATALTYKLAANEKACFFTNVENKGAKLAFYFAVGWLSDGTLELALIKNSSIGSSRRLLRCRLRGWGTWGQDHHGWEKGETGRLRLHRK